MSRDLHGLRTIVGTITATKFVPSKGSVLSSTKVPVVPSKAPAALKSTVPIKSAAMQAASKSDVAQKAADAAAAAQMQADAARVVQRLTSAANSLPKKFSKQSNKLLSVANVIKKKAQTVIQRAAITRVHGDLLASIVGELLGTGDVQQSPADRSFMLLQAANLMNGIFSVGNALALCSDLIKAIAPLVISLTNANQINLANVGNDIVTKCQDVINTVNPDADPPDTSISKTLYTLNSAATNFISTAQSALSGGPANAAVLQQAQALLVTVQGLVSQIQSVDPNLAQTGTGIVTQLQALIAAPSDPNMASSFSSIQSAASIFQQQVQSELAGPGAPGGGGGGSSDGGGDQGGDPGAGGPDDGGGDSGGDQPQDGGSDQGDGGDQGDDGSDPTESFEAAADDADADATKDPNDPYSSIVGELTGRARLRLVGDSQVIPKGEKAPSPSGSSSFLDYFHKPLWTGSSIQIWQAGLGAGAAIILSSVLLAYRRK